MRFRIELAQSRSPHFKLVVRLCRRFAGYRTFTEDGIVFHSVEFTNADLDSFEAIEQLIFGWKTAFYYVNEKLVTRGRVWDHMGRWRQERARVLKAKVNERRSAIPTLTEFFGDNLEN